MSNRRTNDDMFGLGVWAGTAVSELAATYDEDQTGPDMAWQAVETLKRLLGESQVTRDFSTLEAIRRHWNEAAKFIASLRPDAAQ